MVMGLGLYTVAGIAGAIFYIVHHIVVKTTLFLVGGLVEDATGTGALHRLGGLLHRAPAMAALFLLPALSLAGLPPFSGFVAKLALVGAGLGEGQAAIVAVSLAVSLLTLFSMTKIWAGVFWGTPDEPPPNPPGTSARWRLTSRPLMTGATAALAVTSLVIAAGANPLLDLSRRAAVGLSDSRPYIEAVLRP